MNRKPDTNERVNKTTTAKRDTLVSIAIIVVGGMNVRNIDEPMLEAGKRFRAPRRPNVLITIVAPTTISAETKATLEKRGIKIRLVGPPSRDHFR